MRPTKYVRVSNSYPTRPCAEWAVQNRHSPDAPGAGKATHTSGYDFPEDLPGLISKGDRKTETCPMFEELTSIFYSFADAKSGIVLFVGAIILACVGGIAGLITRNLMMIAGLGFILVLIIFNHEYIPLPDDIHRKFEGIKNAFM
jgi:hypothetical protein